MQRLKDKVVVITGGNSGIGEGVARHFHREGAKIVIAGRNQARLDQVKKQIGDNVLAVKVDVTKTADIKALYALTAEKFGKVDALILNAGVGERKHFAEADEDKFDYMVNINYRGAFFSARYALDYLNNGASIIFIASCAATLNIKHHSIYASTKAAVVKLAKQLAFDLADRKIRVNSISPGYIETPIFATRLMSDPDYLARRMKNIPLRRIGLPKDIANAALFLASDEASYITGSDLLIDGGLSTAFREE